LRHGPRKWTGPRERTAGPESWTVPHLGNYTLTPASTGYMCIHTYYSQYISSTMLLIGCQNSSAGASLNNPLPRTTKRNDRTFTAAGPRLWNSLPVQLRNPDITYGLFKRQLKSHLFGKAWTRCSVTSICHSLEKHLLTYLLTYLQQLAPYFLATFLRRHPPKQRQSLSRHCPWSSYVWAL